MPPYPTSRKFRAPKPPVSPDANDVMPRSRVPQNQVFSPGTDGLENPGDEQSFEQQSMDTQPMGSKVKTSTKQPSPAGTRPMNVTARTPLAKAPGLVRNQSAHTRSPKAPGLNQSLGALPHRRAAAKGLNQTVSPARKQQSGKGIAKTISQQKTRNMRGAGANPAFYGDFGV